MLFWPNGDGKSHGTIIFGPVMKFSMNMMSIFGLVLAASMSVASCNSTANGNQGNTAEQTAQTIPFTNGVTDANKGMKKGEVQLKGTLAMQGNRMMYLYSTYGRTNTKIDSAAVTGTTFSFRAQEMEQGVYMVGPNDNNLAPILINPAEKTVEIGFKSGKLEGSLYAINSKENEGWAKYVPQETNFLKQIKDLRISAAKSSIKGELEKQILLKEIELAQLQGQLIGEYPNTHFAKILTWRQEPDRNDITKYWNNIDFSDESLIHGLALSDRIQNFMRSFSKGEESGFINCIANVAEKAKANEVVLEFSLNQMLIGFYESGMENISTFIIDNYVNGESCGDADLSNIIKSTAESIQHLSVGKTPPNITGTSSTGQNIDLYRTAGSKKYTLVMFWSSWCEHCKGEAPEVKQCYDQWSSKGFEIVGYSVDTQKGLWESAITQRGFTFPNLCGMKQWDSKAAKDYRVTKTPAFFLLDSEKKIVLKPKGIREVQAFLAKNLK